MSDYIEAIYDTPWPEAPDGYRQNLQSVTLRLYDQFFVIDPNFAQTRIRSSLRIDAHTCGISKHEEDSKLPAPLKQKKYSAFLGILPVLNRNFLVFVQDVKLACTIEGQDIFEVVDITFVDINHQEKQEKEDKQQSKITQYLFYLREVIFKQGFYFSYSYDLSLSKMRWAKGYSSQLKFCWNAYVSQQLRNVDVSWMIPLMQGSIKTFNVFIEGEKLQYFLINRRSWRKGGTRYNARGLDDRGNVANFVQTEQLIYYKGFACSHVQIRGSVPAFWKQSGISAKIEFTREHESTKMAFSKHFTKLSNNYNNILCLNLLAKNKVDQYQLTLYYEQLVKNCKLDCLRYEYFDFHFACKGQKFERANYLINKIAELNISFMFYAEDLNKKEVVRTQKGVVRTNCLDCLDRTNYVQTKVAMHTLEYVLKTLGINIQKTFSCDSLVVALDQTNKTSEMLIVNFKNAWADAGDTISKHYTGTGSTHTNVTRTGKRDMKGIVDHGMKTLGRFYQQNVQDNFKQQVIDLFVGEHTETINLSEFEARMKEMKQQSQSDDIIGI